MKKIFFLLLACFGPALYAFDDEYYVLFRGFHFTSNQRIPLKESINNDKKLECQAHYTSKAHLLPDEAYLSAQRLQHLNNSGPISINGKSYPSAYEVMQEYFVNNYADMKESLKTRDSIVRQRLRECGLECDDIFLISTSLNPIIALKFAAGIGFPDSTRRYPIAYDEGNPILSNPILGYIDVFLIPSKEIRSLHPYFVVEEFIRHHIDLPYRFSQKNYTLAEEVNFPFLIPGKYHVERIVVDVSEFDIKSWKNPDDRLRYHLKKKGRVIDELITRILFNKKKKRVFLGPLAKQFQEKTLHIVPAEAVKIRDKIGKRIDQIVRNSFDEQDKNFYIEDISINFFTAYAIENLGLRGYPISINIKLSLEEAGMIHLIPIIQAPYVDQLTLEGEDKDGITMDSEHNLEYGIGTNNILFEEFPWRSPHASFSKLISTLTKRKTPILIDITGQSLDHDSYDLLERIGPIVEIQDSNREQDIDEEEEYFSTCGELDDFEEPSSEQIDSDNDHNYEENDSVESKYEEIDPVEEWEAWESYQRLLQFKKEPPSFERFRAPSYEEASRASSSTASASSSKMGSSTSPHELDTLGKYNYKTLSIGYKPDIGALPIRSHPLNPVGELQEIYTIEGKNFRRQNVGGAAMRCFFNAVGLEADMEIGKLKSQQNDPIVRYIIANEIVSASANPEQLPWQVKRAINYELYQEKRAALDIQEEERSTFLTNNPDKDLPATTGQNNAIQEELRERALSLNTFHSFLDHHIGGEQMMVTFHDVQGEEGDNPNANYTSVDAIAYINKLGIKIYSPDEDHSLHLTHQFIPERATEVVYIYHEGVHFQALIPEKEEIFQTKDVSADEGSSSS